jgi:hypothetical protein
MVKQFPKQFTFWKNEDLNYQEIKFLPHTFQALKIFQQCVNNKNASGPNKLEKITSYIKPSEKKNVQINIKKLKIPSSRRENINRNLNIKSSFSPMSNYPI